MFPLSQVVYGGDGKTYRNVQGLTTENTTNNTTTPTHTFLFFFLASDIFIQSPILIFSCLSSSKIYIYPSSTVYLVVLLLSSPLHDLPNARWGGELLLNTDRDFDSFICTLSSAVSTVWAFKKVVSRGLGSIFFTFDLFTFGPKSCVRKTSVHTILNFLSGSANPANT